MRERPVTLAWNEPEPNEQEAIKANYRLDAERVGMTSLPQRATSVGNEIPFRSPRWRGCPKPELRERKLPFPQLGYGRSRVA